MQDGQKMNSHIIPTLVALGFLQEHLVDMESREAKGRQGREAERPVWASWVGLGGWGVG